MQRRFRQAITTMKEHVYVGYAKVATAGGFSDLQLVLVKATSPDDIPLPEKYIQQILTIFSISPTSLRAFALLLARRFAKTRCWRVALKCLGLLHRLFRANASFRSELLWARSNRFITLYPCAFLDLTSTSSSDVYTLFVRSYARLLDESLQIDNEIINISYSDELEDDKEYYYYDEILLNRKKHLRRMLQVLPQLQSLMDRAMDCRPAVGPAERSFLVRSAMKHVIRDSFACYDVFQREVVGVLEEMIQMPYRDCVAAFTIYKKAAAQAEELSEFYEWCKCMGLCGLYEYPLVDRIPRIQIQALENFLNGMWQLSDSPSASGAMMSVAEGNEEHGSGGAVAMIGKFGGDENEIIMGALIDLGGEYGDSEASWEELLDASITMPCIMASEIEKKNVQWQLQVCT